MVVPLAVGGMAVVHVVVARLALARVPSRVTIVRPARARVTAPSTYWWRWTVSPTETVAQLVLHCGDGKVLVRWDSDGERFVLTVRKNGRVRVGAEVDLDPDQVRELSRWAEEQLRRPRVTG
jgi:hypothetical protein